MREAEALFAKAIALAPKSAHVHFHRAVFYIDTGQLAAALEAIDTSIELDNDNAKVHNNRGTILQQLGRLAEAERSFRHALSLDPDLVPSYINLGHLLEERGAVPQALAVYDEAIRRDMDRDMFMQYKAAASGQLTKGAPETWIRSTFDNFAPVFEKHLQSLAYDVPQQLVKRVLDRSSGPFDILDLGCGTGLCGVALANNKHSLVGVDLSEKMLLQAARNAVYDELHALEINHFLRSRGTPIV